MTFPMGQYAAQGVLGPTYTVHVSEVLVFGIYYTCMYTYLHVVLLYRHCTAYTCTCIYYQICHTLILKISFKVYACACK